MKFPSHFAGLLCSEWGVYMEHFYLDKAIIYIMSGMC